MLQDFLCDSQQHLCFWQNSLLPGFGLSEVPKVTTYRGAKDVVAVLAHPAVSNRELQNESERAGMEGQGRLPET